jgi:group I intron endonuclease
VSQNKQAAVYAIKNIVTGQSYVGSTVSWRHRKACHLHLLRKGKHHSVWLQRAWDKYGSDAFVFLPCFNVESHKEAIEIEGEVISEFFLKSLYNTKPEAFGFVGCDQPKTESHKKAIGIAVKESWQNPQIRAKRSISMKGKKQTVSCPHCGLTGGGGNMYRYHFDKCKHKTERTF